MNEYRIRIGRNGSKVHAASSEGVTLCGSQRRANRAVSFLPNDTPVTCEKCGADKVTETPVAPAPAKRIQFDCDECLAISVGVDYCQVCAGEVDR